MSDENNLNAMLQKISPSLSKGEKALSCGTLYQKHQDWMDRLQKIFPNCQPQLSIGVTTNKRLIILPLERSTGMPIKKMVFLYPSDIKIVDDGLLIKRPGNDKPSKSLYVYGYKVK